MIRLKSAKYLTTRVGEDGVRITFDLQAFYRDPTATPSRATPGGNRLPRQSATSLRRPATFPQGVSPTLEAWIRLDGTLHITAPDVPTPYAMTLENIPAEGGRQPLPDFPLHFFRVGRLLSRRSQEAHPVRALLGALQGTTFLGKYNPEKGMGYGLHRLGDVIHNRFWGWILPYLDPHLLKLTRLCDAGVDSLRLYNLLVRNPRLAEMVTQSRLIGMLLLDLLRMKTDQLQPGYIEEITRPHRDLRWAICHLYNAVVHRYRPHFRVHPEDPDAAYDEDNWFRPRGEEDDPWDYYRGPLTPEQLSPGFMVWARRANFFRLYFPPPPTELFHNTGIMEKLLSLDLCPQGMARVRTGREWMLFYTIAEDSSLEGPSSWLMRAFLRNPRSATRAALRMVRKEGDVQRRARDVFRTLVDSIHRVAETCYAFQKRTLTWRSRLYGVPNLRNHRDYLKGNPVEAVGFPRLVQAVKDYRTSTLQKTHAQVAQTLARQVTPQAALQPVGSLAAPPPYLAPPPDEEEDDVDWLPF